MQKQDPHINLQTDPLDIPLTAHPMQTCLEISIKQYPNWQSACIDHPGHWFYNGSVLSWTRNLGYHYRRHDWLTPTYHISEYIGHTWYVYITRYFHDSSPDFTEIAPTGMQQWYNKFYVILKQVLNSSQQCCLPSTHSSLDKYMMRTAAWSFDTYIIPSKSIQ